MSRAEKIGSSVKSMEASNNLLLADVRNTLVALKMVAEDLERDNWPDLVNKLDAATLELIPLTDEITRFNSALQTIGQNYDPSNESTDFKKLIDDHISNLENQSDSAPENHVFYKQFKEAIWKVHHAGEPMPGEEQEQEDIIMTSTPSNLLNTTCPLTGKHITELEEPVRSTDCGHIYEKQAIMQHIKVTGKKRTRVCAAAGCPKFVTYEKLVCDPMLIMEIAELRVRGNQSSQAQMVADCTEIDED